jgi:hypothetical protein
VELLLASCARAVWTRRRKMASCMADGCGLQVACPPSALMCSTASAEGHGTAALVSAAMTD